MCRVRFSWILWNGCLSPVKIDWLTAHTVLVGRMTDNLTPGQRRYCMSRVRGKDTRPEVAVRSALHRRGLRFRKHVATLPGKPDVVFSRARVAVFVDGGFWHGYGLETWGPSVSDFWREKIGRTIERDREVDRQLSELGWIVIRLWQHEIKRDLDGCIERVTATVRCSLRPSSD